MPRSAAFARRVVVAILAALATLAPAAGQQPPQPRPEAAALSFDMIVVDRDGRVPDTLDPAAIAVQVDGKPRRVVAVRRVSRGPGATTDAATRRARAAGPVAFAAEPVRNVLVVVDQASLVRGEERAAIAASQALLDRLGMADRLGVMLLPLAQDQMLSLATEQPVARETLAKTVGRLSPVALARPDDSAFAGAVNPMTSDPDRLREAEPVPPAAPAPAPAPMLQGSDAAQATGALNELAGLLDAIHDVPGRKVVAFFSGGLVNPPPSQVSSVAAAAVAARAAIYVFAMADPRDDSGRDLQVAPLETLARSTGGAVVTPGRNPGRAMTRLSAELEACFVVELEAAATDADGKRRPLRVDLAGRGLNARAPAWLVASADPGDVAASAPAPAAAPAAAGSTSPGAARPEAGSESAPPPRVPSARDAELQVAMARLIDYVDVYERQYSGLVAEEEFRQSSRGRNVRLRSDYLLVKPESSPWWLQFRDVFEVDGVAVRDRDDRLRRLFLDPGVDVSVQLQAIRDESARYNVGIVERNINVPLELLRFLLPESRPRFRWRLAGTRSVAGVEAWRIEFEERVFPTMIRNRQGGDVAAKGWFLVDKVTGAIVETALKVAEQDSTGDIRVSFRHDPALGMWVPAEMTETYQMMTQRSLSGAPRPETIAEGTARYSNFRRFQVKVEEKAIIPK